ncbi:hypothetical protein AS158_04200 [Thermotoga sp. 38H-to]|nr:hypothetical protein AS158_04200 [Thermotoga sp. 38H-to]
MLVAVLLFVGITALRVGVLAFHLTQNNKKLEIEIKELERTYQALEEEFYHISSYFDLLNPSE